MNNDKKVWLSFPDDFVYVKIYGIGASFPDVYDYPAHMKIELEVIIKDELDEYKNSQELIALRKKIGN